MVAIRPCSLPPKFLEMFSVCVRVRASKSYERKANLQAIKIDCFRVSAVTLCGACCVNFLLGGGKWCGPDAVSPCPTWLLSAAWTSSDLNMSLIHSKSNKIRSSVAPHKPHLWCPHHPEWLGATSWHLWYMFSTQGSVNATVLRELKLLVEVIPQIMVWHRCVVSTVCLFCTYVRNMYLPFVEGEISLLIPWERV